MQEPNACLRVWGRPSNASPGSDEPWTSLSVILEDGTWQREERDEIRRIAKRLGASTELHYFDVPFEEIWRRLEAVTRVRPTALFRSRDKRSRILGCGCNGPIRPSSRSSSGLSCIADLGQFRGFFRWLPTIQRLIIVVSRVQVSPRHRAAVESLYVGTSRG